MTGTVHAQTVYHWNGNGGDNNFTTGANWQGGVSPTSASNNDLSFEGTNRLSPVNNYNSFVSWRSILFSSGAGSFNLTSTSSAGWDLFFKIENSSTNSQSVSIPSIALQGSGNEFDPTSGNLSITADNIFTNGRDVTVFGANTLTLNNSGGNGITGTGRLLLNSAFTGTVILTGSNNYTGDTFVNGGTLRFDSGGTISSATLHLGNNTGTSNATLALNGSTTTNPLDVRSGSSGTSTLAGINTTGTSTYSGTITLSRGLTVQQATGGTLSLSTVTASSTQTITVGGGGNNGTVSLAGSVDNANLAAIVNSGTLVLNKSVAGGVHALGSGLTINNGATVQLSGSGGDQIFDSMSATVVNSGGVFDLNGKSETVSGVSLNGTGISSGGALINSNTGASGTLTGTVTLNGTTSLGGAGSFTLATGVAGATTTTVLDKVGAGTVTLAVAAGTNRSTVNGTTQIDGGVLRIQSGTSLNTVTTAVTTINSGVLELNGGITLDQPITFNNGATLRSDGNNTSNGKTTVSNAASASVTISTVSSGDLFTVGNGANDISGGSSTSTIHIAGPGTVRIGNSNDYIGNWSLDAGTTQLGIAAALGATPTSTVTLSTGATLSGFRSATTTFTANPITISGAGTATVLADRSALGGSVTYNFGALSIGGQQLNVTNTANFNAGNPLVTFGATTLTGNSTFNVNLGAGGAATMTLTLGALGDGGVARTITKSGNAALTLGTDATSLVNGTAVNITGGTLNSNSAAALGTLANVTVSTGAIFNVAASQTIGALNSNGTGSTTLGANTLTIGSTNNLSSQFDGVISGSGGSIIKDGTGTLTLTGLNTYTGTTTINNGTLSASNIVVSGSASNLGNASTAVMGGASTTGTLSYTGAAATYTRGFTVNAGGGALTNAGTGLLQLGTNGTTIANGGTLTFATNANGIQDNSTSVISGAGSVKMNSTGAGALTLSAQNTYQGGTTLQQGTITLTVSSTTGGGVLVSGPVGTGTFHIGSGTNAVTLNTNNTATRTLSNNISLEGDTTFALGGATGRIAFDTVTGLTTPNTITLTRTNQLTVNSGVTVDFIGAISGATFGITKLDAGTLNLGDGSSTDSNANTFNGLTTVSGGLVNLRKAAGVDAIAGNLLIDTTGTVALGGNNEQINNGSTVTVNAGGTFGLGSKTETIGNLTVGGGSVTGGNGTLIIAAAGSTTVNSGTVSVSNLTTGTNGLTLGSGATVASSTNGGATTLNGDVTFNGATTGATLGSAGGINSGITLNGNRNFTVATGTSGTDLTVSGAISDGTTAGSGITKLGTGTLAFSAANTYTGGTTVSAGTLLANNSTGSATGSGAVAVNGSGTLGGAGFINAGANTITVDGTLSPGNSAGTIHLASSGGAGALTLSNTSTLLFDITDQTTKDLVALTNTNVAINSATLQLVLPNTGPTGINYNDTYALFTGVNGLTGPGFATIAGYDTADYMAQIALNGTELDLSFTPVPEPSTWAAGALILLFLGVSQRRRLRRIVRSVNPYAVPSDPSQP